LGRQSEVVTNVGGLGGPSIASVVFDPLLSHAAAFQGEPCKICPIISLVPLQCYPRWLIPNILAQVKDYEKFAALLRKQYQSSEGLFDIPTLEEMAGEGETIEHVRAPGPHAAP
jgi:hypothetical protein